MLAPCCAALNAPQEEIGGRWFVRRLHPSSLQAINAAVADHSRTAVTEDGASQSSATSATAIAVASSSESAARSRIAVIQIVAGTGTTT